MTNIDELIDLVVSETMGIYPASSIINGVSTKRSDYGNGWNASAMEEPLDKNASEQWIKGYQDQQAEGERRKKLCREWINNLAENLKNPILEFLETGDLNLYFKDSKVYMYVNCNDIFYWACADSEKIQFEEIPDLIKDGPILWCCKKRNLGPQTPVVDYLKKNGEWNEEFEKLPRPSPS